MLLYVPLCNKGFPHVSVVGSSWNVKISLARWFFYCLLPLRSILSVATAAAAIDCDGCLNAEPVIIDDCRLPADQSGPAGGGLLPRLQPIQLSECS